MQFDLLVKGGEVVDPAGRSGRFDVAVRRDRIAAVEPDIPAEAAAWVIDASGQYVTPGLVDLHTHVFHGMNYFGVDADSIAWRCGTTTWIDAGSSGAFNVTGFREYIASRTAVRVYALMAASYLGMPGLNYDEYANLDACDPDVLVRAANMNRDLVLGIKVRMGTGRIGSHGLEPLKRARIAADELGLPIMCHIAIGPPELADVLGLLRPGDIVTHAYTGLSMRLIRADGRLLDVVREARDRGVRFDIGHGSGSFSFESAEALSGAGFWPDTISTDLHQVSLPGPDLIDPAAIEIVARVRGDGSPKFTILTVMSKFLYLGMPFSEVLRATTVSPADTLGLGGEVGSLRPGSFADIATFVIDQGPVELFDIHGNRRQGRETIRNVRTIVGGRELPRRELPPPPPTIRLVDRE